MAKVVVGMSGGVDSAVTAYLLKKAGYDVIGITLKTWIGADGSMSRCCEIDDARRISYKLGIPYYAVGCMTEFDHAVIEPFMEHYLHGTTPNPCIECNRHVKWAKMIDFARYMGADFIATGHYASIVQKENGRFAVKANNHNTKDQTYMLYKLTQEQLASTIMPLGSYQKKEVREIAEKAGLPVASKPDSQEICFVADGNYADYIEACSSVPLPGSGNFVDKNGTPLGTHKGIIHYTPGQRKGLGIALGYPAYVIRIDAEKNEVVLGKDSSLYYHDIFCQDLNFQAIPALSAGESLSCTAKIRYHHAAQPATLTMTGNGEAHLHFDDPVRAPAPGQSAVFYDDENCVIGGGTITRFS